MNDTVTEAAQTPDQKLAQEVMLLSPEERYQRFKAMLRARKMTIGDIARLATKSPRNHPHVSQVLRGLRKGEKTWPRLADFLTREELIVLGKQELTAVRVPAGQQANGTGDLTGEET